MKRGSVQDYVGIMKERYRKAGRGERGRLLDEVVEVTGYHRKSAIRLMRGKSPGAAGNGRVGRPQEYGPDVVAALRRVWEVADRPCGSRLAPFMEELVSKLEAWEELLLPGEVAGALCAMSASTIDRLLRPYKERGRRPWTSGTRPGSLLKAVDSDTHVWRVGRATARALGGGPGGPLRREHGGVLPEHADRSGHSDGLGGVPWECGGRDRIESEARSTRWRVGLPVPLAGPAHGQR